jgi:hypothetical protein
MSTAARRTLRAIVWLLLLPSGASFVALAVLYAAVAMAPDRSLGEGILGSLAVLLAVLGAATALWVVLLILLRDRGASAQAAPRRLRRCALALAYMLFLVLLVEGVARVAFLVPPLADRLWADESLSWQRWWVARHRAREAGESLTFSFDEFDPTKGWRTRAALRDLRVFDDKLLNTNAAGQRGTRDFAFGPHPGTTRIVVLGDSFTFGEEVSDEHAWPAVLARLLPEAEVINMGVHGYGHDQMLVHLRELGVRYQPDIVLLGFVHVDVGRNLLSFRDYAKPRFVPDGDGLRLTNSPVPTAEEVRAWDRARPRLLDLWAVIAQQIRARTGAQEREEHEVTRRLLDEIARTARDAGATPVLAYLPVGWELHGDSPGQAFLAEYAASRPDTRCMSTVEQFRAQERAGVAFKPRGHWEPPGHAAAAQAVADYLLAEGLVAP